METILYILGFALSAFYGWYAYMSTGWYIPFYIVISVIWFISGILWIDVKRIRDGKDPFVWRN